MDDSEKLLSRRDAGVVDVVRLKAPPCPFPAGNEEWLFGLDSNPALPINRADRLRHLARLFHMKPVHLHEIHMTCYTPTVCRKRLC